jgi:hypothetical protein
MRRILPLLAAAALVPALAAQNLVLPRESPRHARGRHCSTRRA